MGHITHKAIIITSHNKDLLNIVMSQANKLYLEYAGPMESVVNGYYTICIIPDSSKTGWDISEQFDDKRTTFKKWLKSQRFVDNSSSLEWCEVSYGNDYYTASILDHEWKDKE